MENTRHVLLIGLYIIIIFFIIFTTTGEEFKIVYGFYGKVLFLKFLTKISILNQNFDFLSDICIMTKHLIFTQNLDFSHFFTNGNISQKSKRW